MYNSASRIDDSNIFINELVTYNRKDLKLYEREFNRLKSKGVIAENCSIYEDYWYLSDGLEAKRISFNFDQIAFARYNNDRKQDFDFSDFIYAIKFFTIIKIKSLDFTTVYYVIFYFRKFIESSGFFDIKKIKEFRKTIKKYGVNKDDYLKWHAIIVPFIIEFFEFFESYELDDQYYLLFEDILNENYLSYRRVLPSFESAFKFDELIDRFVASAPPEQLEHFFPIVLWWKITCHIPLRTKEFTVIPLNCTDMDNNKYKLTIRRSSQKGKKKSITEIDQTIEGSYKLEDIEITKEIYDLILMYKTLVDKYDLIEGFYFEGVGQAKARRFLLSNRAHRKQVRKPDMLEIAKENIIDIDYFSTQRLRVLLRSFYKEIVVGMYKRVPVNKLKSSNAIGEFEIEIIQAMDTRHLAIMNIILQGVSPIVVQKLAGHDSIKSTFHYYDHLDSYVHNYSYHLAKKYSMKNLGADIMSLKYSNAPDSKWDYYHEKIEKGEIIAKTVDGGWCIYSEEDTVVCRQSGYDCEKGCIYFVPDKDGIRKIENTLKENQAKKDSVILTLQDLIRNRKTIKDFEEKYKTEINILHGCIKQDINIYKEHTLRVE